MPYEGRERTPAVEELLERTAALYRAKQEYTERTDSELAALITEVIENGASLRQIAQRLSVSPETVRKMRDGK